MALANSKFLAAGLSVEVHDFELISQTATHKKVFFRGRLVTETLSVRSPNTDFIKEHTYFGVCTYEISSKRILSLDFSYKLETDISLDSTEEDAQFTYKAEEKMTIRNQWDSSSSQN